MLMSMRFQLRSTGRPGFPRMGGKEVSAARQDRKQEIMIPALTRNTE